MSQTLSGWPSETDSLANRYELLATRPLKNGVQEWRAGTLPPRLPARPLYSSGGTRRTSIKMSLYPYICSTRSPDRVAKRRKLPPPTVERALHPGQESGVRPSLGLGERPGQLEQAVADRRAFDPAVSADQVHGLAV